MQTLWGADIIRPFCVLINLVYGPSSPTVRKLCGTLRTAFPTVDLLILKIQTVGWQLAAAVYKTPHPSSPCDATFSSPETADPSVCDISPNRGVSSRGRL